MFSLVTVDGHLLIGACMSACSIQPEEMVPLLFYKNYSLKSVLSQRHVCMYTPMQQGNYYHGMSHNPIATVNLFLVGKQ